MEIIYKNSSIYIEMLSTIIKDIERIFIYLENLNLYEKILFDKLDNLKALLDNAKDKKNPSNVYITLSDNYLELTFVNYQNILEISSKTDMLVGVDYKILIKRDMKEFYFYIRNVIHQVDEGTYITPKIKNAWNKEHFMIKDNILLYDQPIENFNELLNEKVYKKGSKK